MVNKEAEQTQDKKDVAPVSGGQEFQSPNPERKNNSNVYDPLNLSETPLSQQPNMQQMPVVSQAPTVPPDQQQDGAGSDNMQMPRLMNPVLHF